MKETLDKVLQFLERDNKHGELTKVYYRPSKEKCIACCIFSFILFVLMCLLCVTSFAIGYFILLLVSIALLTFYGINLFSNDGFWIPKYVNKRILDRIEVNEESEEEGE